MGSSRYARLIDEGTARADLVSTDQSADQRAGGATCTLSDCGPSGKPCCSTSPRASRPPADAASSSGSPDWPSTSKSTPSPSPSSASTASPTGRPWSPSPSTATGMNDYYSGRGISLKEQEGCL